MSRNKDFLNHSGAKRTNLTKAAAAWSALALLSLLHPAIAAPFSNETHAVYSCDCNGDGRDDLLVIAKDAAGLSGIYATNASGQPGTLLQSWSSSFLGISWQDSRYTAVIGNFDGVNGDDVLLQRNGTGTSFLLPTNALGELSGISQSIEGWGTDSYRIVAGKFNADARADVFLQSRSSGDHSSVILSDASGHLTISQQSWANDHLGFKWSAANAIVHAGDFNGDGRDDLFVQSLGESTLIDYDIAIPVRVHKPNSFGITLANEAGQFTSIHDLFSRKDLGVNFAPSEAEAIVGDFNGDGRADIALLARQSGQSSHLLLTDGNGQLEQASVVNLGAGTLGAELRTVRADFNGDGRSELYRVARDGSGENSIVSFSGSGGIAATVTHTLTAPVSATGVVGRIEGSGSVSASGAASYQIPLQLPSGPAGVEPSLSLAYNSQSGDGILGPGWSLAGLPSITRCNKTFAEDGAPAGISFGFQDALCLDGERLRITNGTPADYGKPGTTYDTELAQFSQITAHGTTGLGPAYFTAKTRDGLIIEFGNTVDSRIDPAFLTTIPGVPFAAYGWLANKVSNRSGISYTITYGTGSVGSSGLRVPTSIAYAPASVGGAYTHSITFKYGPKAAVAPNTMDPALAGFIGGMQVVNTNLLLGIEARVSGTLTRKYELKYEAAPTTNRARLASIRECAGSAGTQCLPPTTVAYQNGAAGVTTTGATAVSDATAPTSSRFKPVIGTADFNGDGRDDILYRSGNTLRVAFANGSGSVAVTSNSLLPINIGHSIVGTGQAGIQVEEGSDYVIYRWNGSGFQRYALGISLPSPGAPDYRPTTPLLLDVNGDGRDDLITVTEQFTGAAYVLRPTVRLNTSTAGTPSFAAPVVGYATAAPCFNPASCGVYLGVASSLRTDLRAFEFDGDGRADLVLRTHSTTEDGFIENTLNFVSFDLSAGGGLNILGTVSDAINEVGNFDDQVFGHWNDDDCADLIAAESVVLSPCKAGTLSAVPFPNLKPVAALDWNGDGRSDAVVKNGATLGVVLSSALDSSSVRSTSIPVSVAFTLDQDGDGLADLGTLDGNGTIKVHPHNAAGTPPDLAISITDGFGVQFSPRYVSIARGNYTRGTDAVYPQHDFIGPHYVVATLTSTSAASTPGALSTFTQSFQYYRATLNLQGRGFEGFAQRRTHDGRNGTYVYETFERAFPFSGEVKKLEAYQPDNATLIAKTENTWAVHSYGSGTETRVLPYVSRSVADRYEVGGAHNGAWLTSTETLNTVDYATGSLIDTRTTIIEKPSANGAAPGRSYTARTLVPTLFNDFANWCFGRPARVEQTNSHTGPGGEPLTRTASAEWDGAQCRPTRTVIEPGNAQWQLATDLSYDAFGNAESATVTPAANQGQKERTQRVSWGANGRFPRTLTNAKGHVTRVEWNEVLGVPSSITDPNGLVATFQYDAFGRVTRQQSPDGVAAEIVRSACSDSCGAGLRSFIEVIARDANNAIVRIDSRYLDALERVRFSNVTLLDGAKSTSEVRYDILGRAAQQSTPHRAGEPVWFSTVSYDLLGRPTQVVRPTSETDSAAHLTKFSYLGLTESATDALGRTTTTRIDAVGQVLQSIDALGNAVEYEYDAFGQPLKVRDAANNETVLSYNVRGFKTRSSDPDLGAWTYSYFPLGELKSQTSARNQTTQFTYDELSRPLTRVEPEGTTSFVYDTAAHGIGALASVSAPGGYAERYQFDSLSRPKQQIITIDGTDHTFDQTYNALGLLDTLTYPTSTEGVRFKVRYGYANGVRQNVRDYTGDAFGVTFWQANDVNAAGQLIDEQFGNGVRTVSDYDRITGELRTRKGGVGGGADLQDLAYTYDKAGNLTQRKDVRQALTEAFEYDALYRLKRSTLNDVKNLSLDYDAIGNITGKSDVGAYAYHPTKKHAVTSAGANTYTYDANGNAITRNGSGITWTSYNLPSLINGPNNNISAFFYGPNRERYKQEASYGGTPETTLYIGGLLEKVTLGEVTSWRHHVVGNAESAIYTRKSHGSSETLYLSKDHLGSTDAITNATGAVEARLSFSAFGQRRNAQGWSGNPTAAVWAAITDDTRHGYTGHEMLDNLNLTHMNGRVYDQVIGRFLSADPLVQAPFNLQSLNRYSYVFNNPLSFTDPSGFAGQGPDEGGVPPAAIDRSAALIASGLREAKIAALQRAGVGRQGPNSFFSLSRLERSTVEATPVDGGDIFERCIPVDAGVRKFTPNSELGILGFVASTVGGSDFKDFALGFASGLDFDFPTSDGDASTAGFYAGLIAYSLTVNIQDLKNGRAGLGSGRGGGSRRAAASGVNLSKSGPTATSIGGPPGGSPNGGGRRQGPDIVYRVIRPDENPAIGLFPKDPAATYTVEGFVLNGSRPGFASQFIAATRSLAVAESYAVTTGNRIVAINLSKVTANIIDLSTAVGRDAFLRGRTSKNFAAASAEVLIEGAIPANAIVPLR